MGKRVFLSPPWMGGREQAMVEEAFGTNYIAPCGPMVDRFERELAATLGVPQVCAVSSGTAALDLLFYELGVAQGDVVFCSDLTFIASIAPAVHRGASPVFIDCEPDSWTLSPDLLEEALADAAQAGHLPKAVVAVDLYGQCCDYARVEAACAPFGVPLIVDAAEALGARYGGREAGRSRAAGDAGWAGIYSFNGNKIITTSGGGAVASRDSGVVDRARKRAQQSREPAVWYEHRELGYNHRMSNIVAAIGVGQLSHLDEIIARKRQVFGWYEEGLKGMDEVCFMPEAAYGTCTRWLTVAQVGPEGGCRRAEGARPAETARRVIDALEGENIESRPVWKPMHLQPVFRGAKVYGGEVSERLFANGVCLPSGVGLECADVERVCGVVRRCLAESVL